MTHGPPYGILDRSPGALHHAGCPQLLEAVTRMAAIVMTMVAYVLVRYKDEIGEQWQVGGTVAVFALVALTAAGVANIGAL